MSHQLPQEISAIIIDYVADDFEALNNIALTCHDFCILAQSYMFSTVCLNGHAEPTRLTDFKELLQFERRGAILASYIKNISLLFCDDWFTDGLEAEMDMDDDLEQRQYEDTGDKVCEEDEEQPDPFCAVAFISEHAKRLRSIHLGPFTDSHLDWHETSDEVRDALTCIFRNAQKIVFEGVVNIPLSLLRELHNLDSFEISDFVAPGLGHQWSLHPPPVAQIPSLASLAMHVGSGGFVQRGKKWWDMTDLLQIILRRQVMDLSHLTTLYLQFLDSPGRNLLVKETLSSCADTLQDLRLYIWKEDIYVHDTSDDTGIISLAALKSLRFLRLVVNLRNVEQSLLYLTRIVGTIDVSNTRLEKLLLFPDVDNRRSNWFRDMSIAVDTVEAFLMPGSWNLILNEKLSLLYQKWNDTSTRVTFVLPSLWTEAGFRPELFQAAAAGNVAYERFKFERTPPRGKLFLYSDTEGLADDLDIDFNGSFLTFRDHEEYLAAVNGFLKPLYPRT